MSLMMREKIQKRLSYIAAAILILVFVVKGALLMTRYAGPIISLGNQCENQTGGIDHEYIFTVIVYGIVSMLRILEYWILVNQFLTFRFGKQKEVHINGSDFREAWPAAADWGCSKCCYLTILLIFGLLMLLYFVLGSFVIPALGISQEVEKIKLSKHCYGYYHEAYITYCVINVVRYASAFSVRIVMIYCVQVLKKVWFLPERLLAPSHVPPAPSIAQQQTPPQPWPVDLETSEVPAAPPSTAQTALQEKQDLDNWKIVSKDWNNRYKHDIETGEKVQAIHELFQTWFMIPWIAYLISSSLKTYNVLRPWYSVEDGDTPRLVPLMYYLMYNLNQFITLLIPYLCAKKMNTFHKKYLRIMRNNQLMTFKDDPSRLSMAQQLVVDPIEKYDFLPRIIGTNITFSVGDPLYIISIVLAGIFLSVSQSLFSSN